MTEKAAGETLKMTTKTTLGAADVIPMHLPTSTGTSKPASSSLPKTFALKNNLIYHRYC